MSKHRLPAERPTEGVAAPPIGLASEMGKETVHNGCPRVSFPLHLCLGRLSQLASCRHLGRSYRPARAEFEP